MLTFSGSLKIFIAVEACYMRKGFNGLHAMACERLGEDPRKGALFVFINRRHNRIKILYFDGTGLWVMTKRLVSHSISADEPGLAVQNLSTQHVGSTYASSSSVK